MKFENRNGMCIVEKALERKFCLERVQKICHTLQNFPSKLSKQTTKASKCLWSSVN